MFISGGEKYLVEDDEECLIKAKRQIKIVIYISRDFINLDF